MAIRNIVKHPNEILEQKCLPITAFDKNLAVLLDDMHETMVANDGVGIAAPQIGVAVRVAIVDFAEGQEPIEMINPELVLFEGADTDVEGCLSFPGIFGEVERPDHVKIKAQERELYDMLRKDLLIPLKDGDIDAANAASLTGKLLQMSNGAVYDENGKARVIHDHKLEALEDLIEAANGQPVLVAYWFKHDRERIINHLSKLKIKVRDIKSSTDIKDWNAGNIPVALIHPASAGHGLNIQQGGHILIWLGLTWSLELYQQTNARLWRQGQTQVVTIHHIITKDTVDEDVIAALEQKDMTQEKLISAVKAQLGR